MGRLLLLLLLSVGSIFCLATVEQVHIAFYPDTLNINVAWVTHVDDSSTFSYGTDKASLNLQGVSYSKKSWTTGTKTRWSHRIIMKNLQPKTQYFYKINNQVFDFTTMEANPQSYKVCIFGDLGNFNGVSFDNIIKRGLNGDYDFIVHVGDISYDLHTSNGDNGDTYMKKMEAIASKVPYMVIAGNHEDDGKNFTEYRNRFFMPDNGYGDSQFFSFNVGPIHWIGVSTEYYGSFNEYGIQPVMNQFAWLQKDFAAIDRTKTPWVHIYQHRPFYCSNENSADCQSFENKIVLCNGVLTPYGPFISLHPPNICDLVFRKISINNQTKNCASNDIMIWPDCILIIRTGWMDMPGLEALYYLNSVDMGWVGHEHSYERTKPIFNRQYDNRSAEEAYHNAAAPVYVLTGTPGCHTPNASFVDPWPWSAARNNDYGYTMLTVSNSTHLHIEQIGVNENDYSEKVVDDFWMSKDATHVYNEQYMKQFSFASMSSPVCPFKNPACRKTLMELNTEL